MKKGKVLLITPNLKGIGGGVNRIQPSLGLMLIAQVLKDDGHIVKIHDPALEGWNNRKVIDPVNNVVTIGQSDNEISKVISDFSPDVVAISVLFANLLDSAHNIAGLIKKVNKNIKVVLGEIIFNAIIDCNGLRQIKIQTYQIILLILKMKILIWEWLERENFQ